MLNSTDTKDILCLYDCDDCGRGWAGHLHARDGALRAPPARVAAGVARHAEVSLLELEGENGVRLPLAHPLFHTKFD
jgi:hypothetical protein